jgi:molybdenum cofactor biosynthesis enzyme MoaA
MVRGGDWDVLMENLANIAQVGIPLQLNFVVQETNFKEIPAFVELAVVFGAEAAYFSMLENWGSYTSEKYAALAVHFPSHPKYSELLDVLRNPRLHGRTDIYVDLTNLKFLVETP